MTKRKTRKRRKLSADEAHAVIFDAHEYGINVQSRELFLHSQEDDEKAEVGVDFRMANQFIANLAVLNNQGRGNILVHQCTVGGEWEYGMAIYDAIKQSVAPVIILAYAHARSMSSIILQAADLRVMMPNAIFMVHHGTIQQSDTVRGAITYINQAQKEAARMMGIYTERCNVTERTIESRLEKRQEWFMSAEQAVEFGFADGVLGQKGFKTINSIRSKV